MPATSINSWIIVTDKANLLKNLGPVCPRLTH